jgi:dihydroorotate dehydrogenase (fumarate)
MDLSTRYLGFDLPHPLISGASPLSADLDMVRRLEDAGAAAIVMHSLFEEQITRDPLMIQEMEDSLANSTAEAMSFFPPLDSYALGPERYLDLIRRIKKSVAVPVIASLNGSTSSGWTRFARLIEDAGADALELNVYMMASDPGVGGGTVEDRVVDLVAAVRQRVAIPLAVKLSPFFSSLPHLARRLEAVGANALVLFNRFYQPDIDVEALEVTSRLELSTSAELRLRLRWLALLSGRVKGSLGATGGVHTPVDALKAVMAGAHGVQVVSSILERGPKQLTVLRDGLAQWLEEHEYESLAQAHGSMALDRCPDPAALERANYQRVLQSWKRGSAW